MSEHKQKWPRFCHICGRSSGLATAEEMREHARTCTGPPTPREMVEGEKDRIIMIPSIFGLER